MGIAVAWHLQPRCASTSELAELICCATAVPALQSLPNSCAVPLSAVPARQSLPNSCAAPNLIWVLNLIGFKRRATVKFNCWVKLGTAWWRGVWNGPKTLTVICFSFLGWIRVLNLKLWWRVCLFFSLFLLLRLTVTSEAECAFQDCVQSHQTHVVKQLHARLLGPLVLC